MLKEYKFSPPSKVIKMEEGETVPVVFKYVKKLKISLINKILL